MNKVLFTSTLFLLLNSTFLFAQDFLPNSTIEEIYKKHIKCNYTQEYKNRYVPLPLHKNSLPWAWEDKDFPRVISLLEFERFVKEHHITPNKGLAINGIDPEWYYLPKGPVDHINYITNPIKYDLHILDLDANDYDFVMVNQTLEHVYNPLQCLKNIHRHMAPGGILYFNVPAMNIPHSEPYHYYTGLTPSGVGVLVTLAGFKILSIGQWGNVEYLNILNQTHRWPDYRQLKNPGLNDIRTPVITWVFAQKE